MSNPTTAELLALVRDQRRGVQRQCRKPRADDRVWSYTFEHAQQSKPVYVHFLAGHSDDPAPIKVVLRHNVPVKNGWSYRQPCPGAATCPVCRYREDHPEFYIANDRQRYASVVVVVDDPLAPPHERPGAAIFEFGRDVHQLIADELEDGKNPFDANEDWTLLRLQATWTKKQGVPKYLPYSYFTEWSDCYQPTRGIARHVDRAQLPTLSDYPLMHDQGELDFQFGKTLQALRVSQAPSDRVRAVEFR